MQERTAEEEQEIKALLDSAEKGGSTLDDVGMTIKDRSRGRMDIRIRFQKEEAEALIKFREYIQQSAPDLKVEHLWKIAFFKGLDVVQLEMQNLAQEYAKEKLEAQKNEALNQESNESTNV